MLRLTTIVVIILNATFGVAQVDKNFPPLEPCPVAYFTTMELNNWCNSTQFTLSWTFCDLSSAWNVDSVNWNMWDGQSVTTIGNASVTYTYQSTNPLVNSATAYFIDDYGRFCSATIVTTTVIGADPCIQNANSKQNKVSMESVSPFRARPNIFIEGSVHCAGDLIQLFDAGGTFPALVNTNGWSYELLMKGVVVATGLGLPNATTSIFQTSLPVGDYFFELIYHWPEQNGLPCTSSDSYVLTIRSCDEEPCLLCTNFRPDPTKRYWLSAWVKELHPAQVKTYPNAFIQIEFINAGGSQTVDFYTSGDIIEGWQRIVGDFTVPFGTDDLRIHLSNDASVEAFFDDIRINPFNASMKSYVYDPKTLWLTAELDDNNYATFYEYNTSGELVRIKKETARGIMTIQESSSSNPKDQ